MALTTRRRVIAEETGEIAQEVTGRTSEGGASSWIAGLASAVALIFSGISLYHSVLKQPELQAYVPDIVHYTRDATVDGEVFIVPITVANHGARDGTVLRVTLTAKARDTGAEKTFTAAYSVGEDYFVKPGRFDSQRRTFERVDRPRTPFAPISIAGRSHFTGTLLFYRSSPKEYPRVVADAGGYDLTVRLDTTLDESLGPIDQLLQTPVNDVALAVGLPRRIDENRLKRGATQALRKLADAE
ncbi:MAG: hypothetical protein AAFR01_00010 [Pseudomonadota bacterium]